MKRRIVLVGGGHAHMTALLKLNDFVERGHSVTLISPSTHHYYSGMGPGMLSGIYRPQDVRFNVKKMAEDRGARVTIGKVARVEAKERVLTLASGDEVGYDVVSFNTGSHVPAKSIAGSGKNVFTVKPVENLLKAKQLILDMAKNGKPKILVVGGGPAGLEISCNAWRLIKDHGSGADITLIAGERLLPRFPEKARRLAMNSLLEREIQVLEQTFMNRLDDARAFLSDGRELSFDAAFLALGVRPSEFFYESGLPTGETGGLLVNSYLQCVSHPEIFGGGDCIQLQNRPLDKVGVYAVRENPILYHNLMAALEGGEMEQFQPQEVYLLIFNMGNGKGIFCRKDWVWDGKLSFRLKDYIDRRFMGKFQVSGEREEKEQTE